MVDCCRFRQTRCSMAHFTYDSSCCSSPSFVPHSGFAVAPRILPVYSASRDFDYNRISTNSSSREATVSHLNRSTLSPMATDRSMIVIATSNLIPLESCPYVYELRIELACRKQATPMSDDEQWQRQITHKIVVELSLLHGSRHRLRLEKLTGRARLRRMNGRCALHQVQTIRRSRFRRQRFTARPRARLEVEIEIDVRTILPFPNALVQHIGMVPNLVRTKEKVQLPSSRCERILLCSRW